MIPKNNDKNDTFKDFQFPCCDLRASKTMSSRNLKVLIAP
jgi:hypothetical protein